MSIENFSSEALDKLYHRDDIEDAYFHGQSQMRVMDPEVAKELGYPVDPEDAQHQFATGQELAKLLAQNGSRESPMEGTNRKEKIAKAIGAPMCGTCCDYAPCDHIQPDGRGKFRSIGY